MTVPRFLRVFRVSWFMVTIAILLAGIVHIATVFSMPHIVSRKAWDRLNAIGPVNKLTVLPAASPVHQSLPFMAPNIRYAICRYDLSDGPVRLKTAIFDDLSMIAFYTPSGANFYTISGADIKRNSIEVFISDKSAPVLAEEPENVDDVDNSVVVTVPHVRGVVVIRAPLASPSRGVRAEQMLSEAFCQTMVL